MDIAGLVYFLYFKWEKKIYTYVIYIMPPPSFKQSVDKLFFENPSQVFLGIIFVIYLLLNVQPPLFLAKPIDTIFGKILVVVIAAVIFMKTNPVLGVLGFIVAYQLIKTASVVTGTYGIRHYLPSEPSKLKEMQRFNQTETVGAQATLSPANASILLAGTLEEEMVDKMVPLVRGDNRASTADYKPILDGQHGASPLEEA